ncbi:hypothetical protein PybrP1_012511 [[Pythium] brassicae (nom. inval.)]|nr:hypothetical protein PybrP1_012511 [[Pythium] brassicae (nom. inval.)]
MAGLVEKLVLLVGHAFYSDEHVVVLRALIREKFMKDDEMGSAVNLQTRQVRKIMNELHQDHLVCEEVLNDKRAGGSSSTSYWYIDYKYFVDVVQYRLYVMHEHLKDSEQLEIERQTFQCKDPDCGREYTALEAQLLLMPGQFQFRCGHCNEPLLECDNNDRLVRIQSLQRKGGLSLTDTFCHSGNLPSDNRAAGLGGNSVRAAANGRPGGAGGGAANGSGQGSGRGNDGKNVQSYLYPYGSQDQEIIVDIAGNDPAEDEYLLDRKRKAEDDAADRPAKSGPRALPEFLLGSSISGHMAAKHVQAAAAAAAAAAEEKQSLLPAGMQSMEDLAQTEMTEEQRQEAFRKAYMAELERYNEENEDGQEEVEVEVDRQGWDAEMNGDLADDEDLEDVEWEWCDDYDSGAVDVEVKVNGLPKRLVSVDDDDLLSMSQEEFMECYRAVSS